MMLYWPVYATLALIIFLAGGAYWALRSNTRSVDALFSKVNRLDLREMRHYLRTLGVLEVIAASENPGGARIAEMIQKLVQEENHEESNKGGSNDSQDFSQL